MDKDFNNCVRFKDFCKFVKAHRLGKAYDGTDSSISSSDIFNDVVREMWKKADPERNCKIPVDDCALIVSKEMGVTNDSNFKSAIMDEMDKNHDGQITFKEFEKFFSKIIDK